LITKPDGRHPADLSDVRATNLALVLRFVAAHAPCSRADIAAATSMTKATASSLVGELIERQLLRETGQTVRRVGRPATMIEVDGTPYAWVGLDVGPGLLTAVALDPAGRTLLSWRRAVTGSAPNTPGRTLAAASALARRAVQHLHREGRQVLGVTVGVPGPVDGDGVAASPELDWHAVGVRDALAKAVGDATVTVSDSTLLAARAEHQHGEYAGTPDMVYLTGSHRLLAAVIAGGSVLLGGRGRAGLIGHLPADVPGLEPDPAPCGCGCGRTGCLDAVATITALARRLDPTDPMTDLDQSIDNAVHRARANDPETLATLADVGRRLGSGLALVADLLDPTVLVLGGHYARIAPWVIPAAEGELRARAASGGHRLVASALGYAAAATGGATSALSILESGCLSGASGWDRDASKP
jgi:predicted NBD/HSP70 family sugar kinase